MNLQNTSHQENTSFVDHMTGAWRAGILSRVLLRVSFMGLIGVLLRVLLRVFLKVLLRVLLRDLLRVLFRVFI